jgi:hypothetical protein
VLVVKRLGYATGLATICVVSVACGGGDENVASTTTNVVISTAPSADETTTTLASSEISEAVFAALTDGSVDALSQASTLVTPGSPADILVRHQLGVAAFAVAADEEIAALPTTTSTTIQPTAPESTDASSSTTTTVELGCDWTNTCTVYDMPVFSDGGMLRLFSVNGIPVEQMVIGPGPLVAVESVQARVVSGYRAPSGVTALIVSVTAGEESLTTFGFAAIQRPLTSDSAAPIETIGAWGAEQIAAGQSGELLLVFQGTPLDGDVVFSVVTSSSIDLELELSLITP